MEFHPFWLLVAAACIAGLVWQSKRDRLRREEKQRGREERGAEKQGWREQVAASWREDPARAKWKALGTSWKDRRASFLFTEDLGKWPVVRRIAPGVLLMKAPYTGPRRYQENSGLKPLAVVGLVVAVLYYNFREPLVDQAVFAGVIVGAASYPFVRLARKTRFVIRFDHGAMSWKGPDRKKYLVKAEEPRQLQVLVPHRSADDEARKQADWRNSHPRQWGPKPLFQISSELVMHTGPGGRNWLTVAEFCDDASGEQAQRLQTAIEFVTEKAREELAELDKPAFSSEPL